MSVSKQHRIILRSVTRDHVAKAMELFDRDYRKYFEEHRWRKYTLVHNEKLYPPKDLLRCVISVMTNSPYDRKSVMGGGDEINKYFTTLGFKIVEEGKHNEEGKKVILRKNAPSGPSDSVMTGETPSREDVEVIFLAHGRTVDTDNFRAAIVALFGKDSRTLRTDWWEITIRNLEIWSKEG